MSKHQLFKRKTKVEEKVFGSFWTVFVRPFKSCIFDQMIERLFARDIYVGENAYIFQSFRNQQNMKSSGSWNRLILTSFGSAFIRINKYHLTVREWPVSKDNSLFLPLPLLLTVRGLEYSLFQSPGK